MLFSTNSYFFGCLGGALLLLALPIAMYSTDAKTVASRKGRPLDLGEMTVKDAT